MRNASQISKQPDSITFEGMMPERWVGSVVCFDYPQVIANRNVEGKRVEGALKQVGYNTITLETDGMIHDYDLRKIMLMRKLIGVDDSTGEKNYAAYWPEKGRLKMQGKMKEGEF